MAQRLVIRPEAEADIDETYRWYEDQQAELGEDFLLALDTTFQRIRQNPNLYPKLYKICCTKQSPLILMYQR